MSAELSPFHATNGTLPAHRPKNPNDRLSTVLRVSKMFTASGYFTDIKDVAQCAVKIWAGEELGFTAFQSVIGIHIIQGKPSISAALMASKIVREGYRYKVLTHSATACEIQFWDKEGRDLGTSIFTMQDAVTAGLTSNPTWKKYPRNMLWARAMSNGCRWYCSGAFGGTPYYTAEELGAEVDGEGAPIALPANAAPAQQTNGIAPAAKPQSEETTALQAKLDAKRKALRGEGVEPSDVAEIVGRVNGGDQSDELFPAE